MTPTERDRIYRTALEQWRAAQIAARIAREEE